MRTHRELLDRIKKKDSGNTHENFVARPQLYSISKSNNLWDRLPKSHSGAVQNGFALYQVNSCTHTYTYTPLTLSFLSVIRATYLLGTRFKCSARARLDY